MMDMVSIVRRSMGADSAMAFAQLEQDGREMERAVAFLQFELAKFNPGAPGVVALTVKTALLASQARSHARHRAFAILRAILKPAFTTDAGLRLLANLILSTVPLPYELPPDLADVTDDQLQVVERRLAQLLPEEDDDAELA